ncbi:hypothetical protein K6119_06960 [Paracrocinitomix mangrovi]|uniref:hypothetical protein n=1 Tax=Paracrocinitomix mangrovi TaxID=2862509 RepID=UPI001C8E2DA9|nr:hypothetical protein [Paracrocinitomix mangrovi]UKN03253.1 hypothetical protein K6119_06960 [Paracrocinitomix mangrovi]
MKKLNYNSFDATSFSLVLLIPKKMFWLENFTSKTKTNAATNNLSYHTRKYIPIICLSVVY